MRASTVKRSNIIAPDSSAVLAVHGLLGDAEPLGDVLPRSWSRPMVTSELPPVPN
ncbi:hypothetical protein [Amycolatopsis taiwanensis]|uniref:hypothetical protein n=1 Tax=Amycolatopsis taiwanensis TaxID=342230 RepID=UPI0025577299|nr:hypothetical protein [Amycolatopsis taiwanensis]